MRASKQFVRTGPRDLPGGRRRLNGCSDTGRSG